MVNEKDSSISQQLRSIANLGVLSCSKLLKSAADLIDELTKEREKGTPKFQKISVSAAVLKSEYEENMDASGFIANSVGYKMFLKAMEKCVETEVTQLYADSDFIRITCSAYFVPLKEAWLANMKVEGKKP